MTHCPCCGVRPAAPLLGGKWGRCGLCFVRWAFIDFLRRERRRLAVSEECWSELLDQDLFDRRPDLDV